VSQLIEVGFKGNRREFFLWEADEAPPRRAAVVVDADRGEDVGLVHSSGAEAEQRSAKVPHGLFGAPPTRVAKRLAVPDEVRRLDEARAGDEEARRKAMERVKANALVMKITDAEWQWDRKKLTFFFTAEKRVDFRTLVRELASMFRTRIELKQIGVRDEAKRLDGVGRCGRQYCSASWLPELRPVNLGVAKDQRLSLNPSQISGACGRLMCCLRYEHDFYVQSRKKYPKETKVVRTARGEEKVLANDIFRERVTLRGLDGEVRTLPLAELRAEMLAAGDALVHQLDAAALASPVDASHDHTDEYPAMAMSFDAGYTDELPVPAQLQPARRAPEPPRARPPRAAAPEPRAAAPVEPPAPAPHAPAAAVPATPATPAAPDAPDAPDAPVGAEGGEAAVTEGERRSQRRRGRRGGRRNRPGGERSPAADSPDASDASGNAGDGSTGGRA
jgi:cell fate regulator YaaT (PSP1 superfamily)